MQCSIVKFWRMEQWKSFEKFEVEEERIFQQNNATQWFEDNNIQVLVLPWPAQSPDLNPIECLWVHLKKKLRDYQNCGRVAEEWNSITPETCQRLIESMPRRIQVVIKSKGGHTKY